MGRAIKSYLVNWIFQPKGPETGPVFLNQRRIFILPTRQGITFAITLLLMLAGSINYALSLGFVLTFLLSSMGIVAMLHTFRNLAHLKLHAGKVEPVFAGENANFIVYLENASRFPRYSVGLAIPEIEPVYIDISAKKSVAAKLILPTKKRGVLKLGRFNPFTRFPLGLFYAWSNVELKLQCVVYPLPEIGTIPPPSPRPRTGDGAAYNLGNDDFVGLRPYQPGDSPRHIAWKAVARSTSLLTKQFSGHADAELWLDWGDLPATLNVEAKLS